MQRIRTNHETCRPEVTVTKKQDRIIQRLDVRTRAEWRRWLRENGASSNAVWLVLHKKASPEPGISYEAAVEEALAFGWIDSKPNKLDEHRYLLYFAQRKPGSVWSARNKERVKKLVAARRMTAAGLAKVRAARRDGSWNSLDDVDKLQLPQDLQDALAANKKAALNFERFSTSSKRIILYWIGTAKRPGTRSARITKTVSLAARNIRANHFRQ